MRRRLWNPAWLWVALFLASALAPTPAFSETRGAESLLVDIEYQPDSVHAGDNAVMTISLQNTGNDTLTVDMDIFAFDHVNPKEIVGRHTWIIIPAGETFAISANWRPTRSTAYDIGVDVFDNGTRNLLFERSIIVIVESNLSASVSVSPAAIHVSDNVTVSAKLCNTGYSMLYGIHYAIYAGLGNYIGSGDVAELWPAAECESVPGGGVELEAHWTPAAPGTYAVGINASDATGTNPVVRTFDVTVGAEAVSISATPSSMTVGPGAAFNIAVAIHWPPPPPGLENPRPPGKNTHIATPLNNSNVSGMVNITASVMMCDCMGFTKLYVDKVFISNGTKCPSDNYEHFSHLWDSSTVMPGIHNITVIGKHNEYCDTVFVIVKQSLFVEHCPEGWNFEIWGHTLHFEVPADVASGTYSIVLAVKDAGGGVLAEASVAATIATGSAPSGFSLAVSPATIDIEPGESFNIAASVSYTMGSAQVVPSKNTQIMSPPDGSFVRGNVAVRAWVQTCNCTGGTELYVDGVFHSNGTRPPPTLVEFNGTYYEVFEHYWDSSAASEGWHNLTVLGKHKEFCDTVLVCVNAICGLVVASSPAGWTYDPSGINFTPVENVPVTAAFTFAVPADAQYVSYSIVLWVTGPLQRGLAEAVVTVTVAGMIYPSNLEDLSVSAADIRLSPDPATEGTACALLATVRNLGLTAGTGIVVVSDTNGTSIGSRDISLESGGIVNLSFEWKPSAGNHTIEVTVVTLSERDLDMANNLAMKTFMVLPKEAPQPPLPGLPRLRLALDRDSVTIAPGGSVLVTATVSCEGAPVRGVHLAFTPSEGLRVDVSLPDQPIDLRPGDNWTASLRLAAPQSMGNASRSGKLEVAVAGIGAAGDTRELRVAIVEAQPSVATRDLSVPLAAGALASGIVVIAVAAYGTEVGLVALLGLLLPLYSKIRKEEVLDQFTRGKIQGYITAYPGEHYSSIKAQLGLNNGALAYHLRVLEREGFVVSFRDGIYRRYYPKEAILPKRRAQFSQMQEMIIEHIRSQPGITQDGLAQLMKVSNQVIYYHVRHLMTAGAVRLERAGKETHCYIPGLELS